MFEFYQAEGFKMFKCNLDKTPNVQSWRATECHIDADEAERRATTGNYIGAWPPPNYVIIDVDRNHTDKQGNTKPDGMPIFQELCTKLGVDPDIAEKTRTVKTGSGGLHLYFTTPPGTDYRELSPKAIAESVDVKTHLGYVIAAGTNGYSVVNDAPPIEIPSQLLTLIQTRNKDKAPEQIPKRLLPAEVLKQVLRKLPAEEFASNDVWQEFVTSCIAVASNSEDALDVIEEWSKSDSNYKDDPSIRKRIETFEVAGGITAGTFLHVLREHGVSKYLIDKVRMFIGAEFNLTERFSEVFEPGFTVDYAIMREAKEIASAFFYQRNQVSAVKLFTKITAGNLIYVSGERAFFYFDGNKWIEQEGILETIFSVLVNAAQHFYTDFSKPAEDADAEDHLSSCVNYVSAYAVLTRFEAALKQHSGFVYKSIEWDSPDLSATLTLKDGVMDFSDGKNITFRPGKREEYRRLYIDLSKSDFDNREMPTAFRAFLKDVFPDEETRKTATYALSTMISGTGRFRTFQLWNGAGSNGKSTLMEIMKEIIGQRAITYKPEVLLNKSHTQSLTPELAMFRGALVGFASETEESKRISQGQVKALTGNETIVANPKYKDVVTFATTFQLVLSTNYLPTFSAHDEAFIDRVLVLPFYTCFYKTEDQKERASRKGSRYFVPARNPDEVEAEILKERAQILYYLARRFQEISESVIPESAECLQSKRHYVDDNNDIFQFFNEFVEYSDERVFFTPTKDLTSFYNEENNTRYSSKFVILRLKEAFPGIESTAKMVDGKFTRGLKGIRLKYGAYPEGWQGNYTPDEVEKLKIENAEF